MDEQDLGAFAPITLAAVTRTAALQTRTDSEYLLAPDRCRRLRDRLAEAGGWSCLEIDRRRRFTYESVYFDTPDLLTYRQHRQGRRRRFKARSRTYADTGECAFEVKRKGSRQDTVKERLPYRAADADRLTAEAAAFLDDLAEEDLPARGRDRPAGDAEPEAGRAAFAAASRSAPDGPLSQEEALGRLESAGGSPRRLVFAEPRGVEPPRPPASSRRCLREAPKATSRSSTPSAASPRRDAPRTGGTGVVGGLAGPADLLGRPWAR